MRKPILLTARAPRLLYGGSRDCPPPSQELGTVPERRECSADAGRHHLVRIGPLQLTIRVIPPDFFFASTQRMLLGSPKDNPISVTEISCLGLCPTVDPPQVEKTHWGGARVAHYSLRPPWGSESRELSPATQGLQPQASLGEVKLAPISWLPLHRVRQPG